MKKLRDVRDLIDEIKRDERLGSTEVATAANLCEGSGATVINTLERN
jgi:hypothetical protein